MIGLFAFGTFGVVVSARSSRGTAGAAGAGGSGPADNDAEALDAAATGDAVPKCSSDQVDCDGDSSNGCEANLAMDSDHRGSCARKCNATNGTHMFES